MGNKSGKSGKKKGKKDKNGHPSEGTTTATTTTASSAASPSSSRRDNNGLSEGELLGYDENEYARLDQLKMGEAPTGMLYSKTSQKVTKDDFVMLKVVGRGSFGKVLQVMKKDDQKIYAMKVLKKNAIIARKQVAHTLSERDIMQKIEHPFIVKLHYAFQTPDKLYMVMDFVNGGELFYHLKNDNKFDEVRVRLYAAEITLALAHLHELGIVYRDLKPENILIDYVGHIRITDFGLSKEMPKNGGTSTFCGTPEYLAPEVLKGKEHGTAVDWWSLGTLIYEMLTGLPPFYNPNHAQMYQKILTGDIKYPPEISPDARSLLTGLLQQDPAKRFTAKEVKAHPWFASIDWVKLYNLKITPTWRPPVSNQTSDLSMIDKSFTDMSIAETPGGASLLASEQAQFDGFSYTPAKTLT